MEPSESAIESAIDKLRKAPGSFQRLGEDYVRIKYRERFKNLQPSGRKSNDVPVRGWPDAWAEAADGRMDIVEATTLQQKSKWLAHLQEDVKNAAQHNLAGFVFIAWVKAPKNSEDNDTLWTCRKALQELRIPPGNIDFVFQEQLVAEIRQPAFARVWQELLGLSSSCEPFDVIDNARFFARAGDTNRVIPTLGECRNDHVNRVHRPRLADKVEARLEDPRWALVRGVGASGKTILAAQIGVARLASGRPVYYLDLTDYTTDSRSQIVRSAQEAVTSRADPGVLFIIDNVHLDEIAAKKIFTHWQSLSTGSDLLMLGRSVNPGARGRRPLSELDDESLELRAGPKDLTGVFVWLRRRLRPDADNVRPPGGVLHDWERLFGGDLFAFSVAVAGKIGRLVTGDWTLVPDDAKEHIRDTWLVGLGSTERTNLLQVAALATLELDTPREVLDENAVTRAIETGTLHRLERGEFIRFRLVHAGLGRLLLAADPRPPDRLGKLIRAAQLYPFCAMEIAARLEAELKVDDAIKVVKVVESPPGMLEAILRPGLHYTHAGCERLTRLRLMDSEEADKRLSGHEEELRAGLLRTPLGFIPAFLEYAEGKLPRLKSAVNKLLQEPETIERLGTAACASSWDGLLRFLRKYSNAPEVLATIDREAWNEAQLVRRPKKADVMHSLFRELRKLGHPDLSEAPARALVRHADSRYWHKPVIGLHHVGTALRLANQEEGATKLRFLKSVVTKEWLQAQYENPKVTAGTIAALLYGLWTYPQEQVLSHFLISALKTRLQRETNNLQRLGVEQLSWAIQLLGCAALCEFYLSSPITLPDTQINNLVGRKLPQGRNDIGHIQVQLWLGLREMARVGPRTRIRINPTIGDRMLALWKNARGRSERQKTLNSLMIEWLETSQKAEWLLQADRVPFAKLLAADES